jgi:AraC-like DNA-binding protein/quercetin dioxygenase-like cupin family protein
MPYHAPLSVPSIPFPNPQFYRMRETGTWPREGLFPDPAFPFTMTDNIGHPEIGLHSHEGFAELVLIYGGSGEHFTSDAEHRVSEGDVFVVTSDMTHGYRNVEDLHLLNILFDPDRILASIQDVKKIPGYHALFHLEPRYRSRHDFASRLRLAPPDLSHALALCEEMARVILQRPPGYEFVTRAVFMQMVWFLCTCYTGRVHPKARSLALMGEVISYLERNYTEDVTLDTLAGVAGMSVRNLLLLFKEATGHAPIEYLLQLRVARAAELLGATEMTVTDIAGHVGFNDSNYFTRQFRRITGVAPSVYRKRRA